MINKDYWTHFGKELNELVMVKEGSRVLDIGTGSGSCLIPAAERTGTNGEVIGIDMWEQTVQKCRATIKEHGLENACAMKMDANSLSFESGEFDHVLSGFIGYCRIYDFEVDEIYGKLNIFQEMHRVLKKGGTIGLSSWALQADIEWLRKLVRRFSFKFQEELPQPEFRLPPGYSKETAHGLEKVLDITGFENFKTIVKEYQICYKDEDEYWDVMSYVGGYVIRETIGTDRDMVNKFRNFVIKSGLSEHKQEEGVVFIKKVIFATATK